jgi:putative hydrolase
MERVTEHGPIDPSQGPPGDPMRDVPLFREIQRVLMASTGPVNWELARQVGIASASWGADDPQPTEAERAELEQTVRASELAVVDLTALPAPADVSRVEAVRRAQWVEASIASLKDVIEPIAGRLTTSLGQLQGEGFPALPGMPGMGMEMPGSPAEDAPDNAAMASQVLGMIGPLLMGVQAGTVLGALGQRVFGQYDLAVPRPPGGLSFVVSNITRFEQEWELPRMEFRAWVALHEVTHRLEFAEQWAREHFVGLVRDLVEHAEIDLSILQQRLESMDLSDPSAMSQGMEGIGNVFGEASSSEQRLRIARVQAFVLAAEGYADHVTETVGRTMLSSFGKIDEAVRRFREGRPGDQALEQLLGLQMTDEQHRLGRGFCDTVAAQTAEATLSRIWGSADSLPSMPELEEPTLWLARMA